MATSVFIVDDHYMVIEGIRSLLQNEKDIEWAGHAMNAASCLAFLKNRQPDVILMDISLPDQSGIELCKEVKEKYPSVFIVGLSTFNQQSFIRKMMDNGASGYVLKNATQHELTDAIGTVVKGKHYLSEEASLTLRKEDATAIALTRREKEVLGLIADGMTNAAIAQKLFISIATVETHRKNLLAKLEAKNTASLIRKAAQMQFI
ncbi:response regulator transcription factor [Agriterribacter sp.]|uniref:response regulator transcription factor n=1 Tax=Agriterribacter sp. TaxID=2821509 RepID=UPI002B677AA2|nr:response regulator transcription factor [Agriterribacter sp.]HRO46468.1 response regulator transcription factor [Agriterribacter sp.]HRQ17367.1 response regulator transcription factor [Agriterribacter sp.]